MTITSSTNVSSTANTFVSPPQPITQGATNDITFTDGRKISQRVVIQSDADLGGAMSIRDQFTEFEPATFDSTRLPGTTQSPNWSDGITPIPPTVICTPISSANHKCFVMEILCFSDAAGTVPIKPCNIT